MKKPGPKARASVVTAERRTEKLHKVMADAGLGSRREMERWIVAGRVTVGGTVVSLGARVSAEDQIAVDGVPLHHRAETTARILLMNKADGVVCTRRDPEGQADMF